VVFVLCHVFLPTFVCRVFEGGVFPWHGHLARGQPFFLVILEGATSGGVLYGFFIEALKSPASLERSARDRFPTRQEIDKWLL
jgi:hypothetical protein